MDDETLLRRLRERVVNAMQAGESCRSVAAPFGVATSDGRADHTTEACQTPNVREAKLDLLRVRLIGASRKLNISKKCIRATSRWKNPSIPSQLSVEINTFASDCATHTLGHTHASRLIQNGLNIYEVRSVLSHTKTRTMMRCARLGQADVSSWTRDAIDSLNQMEAAS